MPRTLAIWEDIDATFKETELTHQYVYITHAHTPATLKASFYEDVESLDWFRDNLDKFITKYCAGEINTYDAYKLLYTASDWDANLNPIEGEYNSDIVLRITPDGRVEGFAIIEDFGSRSMRLNDFCIASKGAGIGRDMLCDLVGAAIEVGTREITISAVHRAVPFYKKLGFAFDHAYEDATYEKHKADPAFYSAYDMTLDVMNPSVCDGV